MTVRAALLLAVLAASLPSCGSEPGPSTTVPEEPATEAGSRPADVPRFDAPEGWVREATTSEMRLHQFRLPGSDEVADGVVVVASWPNGIGPRETNLERWAAQMGLEAIPAAGRSERRVRGFEVTGLDLEGAFQDMGEALAREDHALLASWIEIPGDRRVWTVKATGPRATIERWRASYDEFIAGL